MGAEPGRALLGGVWRRYRVLVYLFVGLVLVEGAVATCREVWQAYDPDDYQERLAGCRRQVCDLILVGGSCVSEGVDPAVLSGLRWRDQALERAYNLGLPGATEAEIWHAVSHGVAVPPRLLVYGITASDLNEARNEPHGVRSLMDLYDVAHWIRGRPHTAGWCLKQYSRGCLARLWGLFYHRNGIRMWAADQVEALCPGTCPEAASEAREALCYSAAMRGGNGFAPRGEFQRRRLDQLKAAGVTWQSFPFLEKYEIKGYRAYLDRLLDWAEAHGVPVVLVDMPVSADLEERLYPHVFATYRTLLAELERDRGLTVIRARREVIGLQDEHFADLIHLNLEGTARFSRWLRRQLEIMGEETVACTTTVLDPEQEEQP